MPLVATTPLVWLFPEGRDTTAVPVQYRWYYRSSGLQVGKTLELCSGKDSKGGRDALIGWDGASDGLATNYS